jgi:hypothetical protein
MNWKLRGRKRSWPNLRYYPGIFLEEQRNTTNILSQDRRSLDRDFNPGPPEYDAGVLTTRLRRSVLSLVTKLASLKGLMGTAWGLLEP